MYICIYASRYIMHVHVIIYIYIHMYRVLTVMTQEKPLESSPGSSLFPPLGRRLPGERRLSQLTARGSSGSSTGKEPGEPGRSRTIKHQAGSVQQVYLRPCVLIYLFNLLEISYIYQDVYKRESFHDGNIAR